MTAKKRSSSSVPMVQVLAMVVLVLIALIGLAFMLVPRKPPAPPRSRTTYESRPEAQRRRYDEPTGQTTAPTALDDPAPDTGPGETTLAVEVAPDGPEVLFSITGAVVAGDSRRPVNSAQVSATRKRLPEDNERLALLDEAASRAERALLVRAYSGRSDSKGAFSVAVHTPGVYEVVVKAHGFVPFSAETVYLDESLTETALEVRLSSGASLSGRVVEAGTSTGAGGLKVRVDSQDGPFGLTDNEGNYQITGLMPGQVGVAVDLRGSPYMAGRDLPYQRVEIKTADEKLTGVDFSVEAAGIVWGYVLSPNQEPIPQASVILSSSDSMIAQAISNIGKQTPPITDSSGEDGYYELAGVPLNQEWRIHAMSTAYAPQLSDVVLLSGSHRNARIDIFMFAGTNVYGQVVSGDGSPVPGAEVMCIPAYSSFFGAMTAPQAFRNDTADADGAFTLLELPAGEYQIFAQKKGFKVSPIGYPLYPDGYSDLRNVNLTLRAADEGAHMVYGSVVNDRGQGIDGAQVRLAGVSMGGLEGSDRSMTTSNNGTFRFDGVSAGQYTIIVTCDEYSPTTVRRVRLNEETRVVLRQSARVRGRVLIKESNSPPETYDVSAYPLSPSTGSVSVMGMMSDAAKTEQFYAPDGSFELIINAGAYRLEASASGYTPARTEISVEPGEVRDGIVLTLDEKGGKIAGKVTANDGNSVQGATVTLLEASSPAEALMMLAAEAVPENRIARLGDDGLFVFDSLPPGEYVAIAQHPNYPTAQSDLLYLAEGESQENLQIRFGAGGAIEGYVYKNGEALAEAVVVVVGNGVTENTTADESGYYYLDGLASGTYQAMVTDISSGDMSSIYDARGVQVQIVEGSATRYDFGVGAGARIEGRCIPGPVNLLGGRAVLQYPGYMQAPLGETVEVTQLLGQSVGINPLGGFVMEDVPPGEWQLDIYYFEMGVINPLDVRFVHTELIQATEDEVITLELPIGY